MWKIKRLIYSISSYFLETFVLFLVIPLVSSDNVDAASVLSWFLKIYVWIHVV